MYSLPEIKAMNDALEARAVEVLDLAALKKTYRDERRLLQHIIQILEDSDALDMHRQIREARLDWREARALHEKNEALILGEKEDGAGD